MTTGRSASPRLTVTVSGRRLPPAARGLGTWLVGAAPRTARGTVDIALVSDVVMRRLNREFRGVDKPTDVLSFPAEEVVSAPRALRRSEAARGQVPRPPAGDAPLGDIAIALGVAGRQAAAEGHSLGTELRVLALHGLLHLLGYDHETDRGTMRRVEERLRRRAGLPSGLIGRTPGATRS